MRLLVRDCRSRKDAAHSVPVLPLPFHIDSFFRRSSPTALVSRYMNEGGLKREASLGTKTKLRRPSRRPQAEIEKNRNYTRRERKPARSRVPMRFNPLRRSPIFFLLWPSTDVIGASKKVLRAQLGNRGTWGWPPINVKNSYTFFVFLAGYLISYHKEQFEKNIYLKQDLKIYQLYIYIIIIIIIT